MSSSIQDENTSANQPMFSEPANVFQPTAQVGDLAQETLKSGTEIVGNITDIGSNIIGSVGELMAEPATLFQPTKSISMLGSLTQQTAQAGMESGKELLQGSTAVVTGAITDITDIGKDIANIWIDPAKPGEGVFEPKQPIEHLSSIGSKVMQTGVAVAEGTVGTGVNVAKKILGTGTNILKKGLGIFGGKKENGE